MLVPWSSFQFILETNMRMNMNIDCDNNMQAWFVTLFHHGVWQDATMICDKMPPWFVTKCHGLWRNAAMICDKMLPWSVTKCCHDLWQNAAMICDKMLPWSVTKCHHGLWQNVTMVCDKMLPWFVTKCYHDLWQNVTIVCDKRTLRILIITKWHHDFLQNNSIWFVVKCHLNGDRMFRYACLVTKCHPSLWDIECSSVFHYPYRR